VTGRVAGLSSKDRQRISEAQVLGYGPADRPAAELASEAIADWSLGATMLTRDLALGPGAHPPWWALPLLAAVALASVLLIVLLAIHLSRRNRMLIAVARRWAGGELSYRLPERGRAGFRELSAALNQAAAALQRREEIARGGAETLGAQGDRLATTARLAAGVAHEINNPLGGILLYGNLLLEKMPESDPNRETVREIVEQAARAKEIVVGLLDFARQRPPRLVRHDLNDIVHDVLALVEREPRRAQMQLRVELSTLPLFVRVDAMRIQQVLVNILLNAIDAMREGGQLTVRSGLSERGGFCRVAISDTGSGIRDEDLPRIFEPFFTTKDVGDGVGLGLAISYGIVQQHGGEIEVQSRLGAGSTFRVILPLAGEE
jgi:two-component system, NtrC family, sensor kinase